MSIEPGAPDRLTMWATRLLVPIDAVMVVAGTASTAAGPHAGGSGTGDLVELLYGKSSHTRSDAWGHHNTLGIV